MLKKLDIRKIGKNRRNWKTEKQEMQMELDRLQEDREKEKELKQNLELEAEQLRNVRDQLENRCGQLENRCSQLQEDNDRVYAGHTGMEEEINFLKFRIQTLDELHESVVFGQWPHDGSFRDYTCRYPFERVEILPKGEVYTCCSAYVKHNYYIGNIFEQDFPEIWNSDKAKKLRYSVKEGNFEFCQKYCKFLHMASQNMTEAGGETNPVSPKEIGKEKYAARKKSWKDYAVLSSPKYITLACDESCNLYCPSCRSSIRACSRQESDRLYERLMKTVRPMLSECEMFVALGSGEVFASSAVSRFLQTIHAREFPKLHVTLVTNLQLADEKKWKEFSNLMEIPKDIRISIDAASQKTYEENRRGGGWKRLQHNLEYLRSMKKDPDAHVEQIGFNFVVQKNNYREIEAFMEMAQRMDADMVEFQKLTNWGTFSEQEYFQRDVLNKANPEYESACRELKKALESADRGIRIVQNIF